MLIVPIAKPSAPNLRLMKNWLIVCLTLLLTPLVANGEETRGTLARPISEGQVVVKVNGDERRFRAPHDAFFMGIGRRKTDASHFKEGTRVLVRHEGNKATEVFEDLRWYQYPGEAVEEAAESFSEWWGGGFLGSRANVMALASVVLVSLVCGVVSSLVVSNRMAFFGDALAHCAFAGVGLGLLLYYLEWLGIEAILAVMILFGILVGVLIAYVRSQTSLASDTVIGVFFAGAMGFGAVLLQYVGKYTRFGPEEFVFGTPFGATGHELFLLLLLLAGTVVLFWRLYNRLVFASFNPSLARSRNFPVELGNYAFIVLLALVVNLCLKVVGALLINALLILPAAAAANLARNLRQFFWLSTTLSLLAGLSGWLLSHPLDQGGGGMIVLVGVGVFFVSMLLGRFVRGRRALVRPGF